MMKIVIAPDSYKGTYSSIEISLGIEQAIHKVDSRITTVKIPISDGGDGFLDCFKERNGVVVQEVPSFNSMMKPLLSKYIILNQEIAIIELAATAGLSKVEINHLMESTTYGVGIQILDALSKGIRRFILGIGGSATADAGVGILQALGCVFLNPQQSPFFPKSGSLEEIDDIDLTGLVKGAKESQFTIYSDVTNPLLGKLGANHIYSKQKGADEAMILDLERNMTHFSMFLSRRYGFSTDYEGAGAAGGCSVSLKCFLHAKVVRGIESLLELLSFQSQIEDASLIITGEGKLDEQSFYGKVLDGILSKANQFHIPVVSISGQIDGLFEREGLRAISLFESSKEALKHRDQTLKRLEVEVIKLVQSL